jgi:hypothetical protein
VRYGDLIAAADDCDLGGDEPALFSAAMRVLSQGLAAMNEDSRTICDDGWTFGRALPRPVENQRLKRAHLRHRDWAVVMKYRS